MSSNVICLVLRRQNCAISFRKLNYFLRHSSNVVEKPSEYSHDLKTKKIKKPAKEPFMKNVFLGKFDTELLAFPEVLESDELKTLEENLSSVDRFLKRKNSSHSKSFVSNEESLDELRKTGVFGLQIPSEYGGLNLTATEYSRYSEVLSQNLPLLVSLTAHQGFGVKGLLRTGNEDQKKKYLPLLASGEWTGAFCIAELHRGIDATTVKTKALLSEDGKSWLISGSKIAVCDNRKPDLITLIAKTEGQEFTGKLTDNFTAFLIEATYPGITIEKYLNVLGDRGINLYEIKFENTPVPLENLLGNLGDGYAITFDSLNSNRFTTGCVCAGILRNILQVTTEHVINHKEFGKNLMDLELIKQKLAKITCSIYIMESMTYVTAGLLDMYDQQDTIVEGAIVKIFSSEELVENIIECQNIMGFFKFFEKDLLHSALRSSQVYTLLEGSNNVLRMLVAVSGLQHIGPKLNELVTEMRNPLLHPGAVFKRVLERSNYKKEQPKLVMGLDGYLHPSLQMASRHLEYCILKLQYAAEVLLVNHGSKIVEKEMDLNRLANIAIGVYAMTAVLARASRSYCIGLQNADLEVQMAGLICQNTFAMVKQNVLEIDHAFALDDNKQDIAKRLIDFKGYCLDHPLSRTFD